MKNAKNVTGWPLDLLQADSRQLSQWLSNRINSKSEARNASISIFLKIEMTNRQQRFEKWAKEYWPEIDVSHKIVNGEIVYKIQATRVMWDTWQGCMNTLIEEMEKFK